jgi:CelD/BcsL family acetyltransferase involved in cellulose biosynthesis
MPVQEAAGARRGEHTVTRPEVFALTEVDQLGARVDEWRDLAVRIEGSSYFQTPNWVLTWWEDAGRPPTEIAFWRSTSGVLDAVAYLTQVRERLVHQLPFTVRLTTNTGSGRPHSADCCGWPVMPHRVADVRRWIATHHWGSAIILRHLDRKSGVPCVPPGARLVLTTPRPLLHIVDGCSGVKRSKNFRKHIARCRRRLQELGVSFVWVPPEAMTTDIIDALFALSDSRRSLKGTTSFRREHAAGFHRRLIGWNAAGRGTASVVAVCGGRPVGMEYGFIWGDTFYYYQGGWDAAWEHLSLGTVLVAETICLAQQHGVQYFDFLRGREPYKYRFGAEDEMDESWLVPRGFGGWIIGRKFQVVGLQRAWRETWRRAASGFTRASSAAAPEP